MGNESGGLTLVEKLEQSARRRAEAVARRERRRARVRGTAKDFVVPLLAAVISGLGVWVFGSFMRPSPAESGISTSETVCAPAGSKGRTGEHYINILVRTPGNDCWSDYANGITQGDMVEVKLEYRNGTKAQTPASLELFGLTPEYFVLVPKTTAVSYNGADPTSVPDDWRNGKEGTLKPRHLAPGESATYTYSFRVDESHSPLCGPDTSNLWATVVVGESETLQWVGAVTVSNRECTDKEWDDYLSKDSR